MWRALNLALYLGSLPFPSMPLLSSLNAAFLWLVTSGRDLGMGRFSPEQSLTVDSGAKASCLPPLVVDYSWHLGWEEDLWYTVPC